MTDGAHPRESQNPLDPTVPDPAAPDPVTPDPVTPDPVTPDPVVPDPVVPGAADPAAVSSDPDASVPPSDPGDIALLGLVDRLAAILDRSELTELEVQVGGTGLVLRKPVAIASPVTPAGGAVQPGGGQSPAGADSVSAAPAAPARPSVKAPLTGIWYGSPSPGTAPFVTVGGEIVAGQVIGLIEAMKLFNEIKSDLSGRVARIHAENGKLVKARQPLIEVDPL